MTKAGATPRGPDPRGIQVLLRGETWASGEAAPTPACPRRAELCPVARLAPARLCLQAGLQ